MDVTQLPFMVIGAPVEVGTALRGCAAGPNALRRGGLLAAVRRLGPAVSDAGDVVPGASSPLRHPNRAVRDLGPVAAWVAAQALGDDPAAHADRAA